MTQKIEDIIVISEESKPYLNTRQETLYREHREDFIQWMLDRGKDLESREGYAPATAKVRSQRTSLFYRYTWENITDGFTLDIGPAECDEWMKHLAQKDYSKSYKACCYKAVKTLLKYLRTEKGRDIDWEPAVKFTYSGHSDAPRDFLTREERTAIREAAMEYGTIPHYHSCSPEERDEWKTYLAQRFEKPKEDVGKSDWERANSFKIPSLVWTSMDAGLRPVEVGRAQVYWIDTANEVLRIPREESSKNEGNWIVSLKSETATILENWLKERKQIDRYSDSDRVWLTRQGNPYQSQSLNYILGKLCDSAGIETENRDVTWYSIRHSVGTYMANEGSLSAAKTQLRHKSEKTTMKYDQAPVEERKDVLDQMG